ncbi:HEPN domain-containing protein [Candidatus Micrarchaeota archaeon]|nr:HEPN domain-containing protein [Candidatus Micrarchaeota archaeon]
MSDTTERAFHEAESWLFSAKHGLADAEDDYASANVCCAQAIHAIIRANDALCLKFIGCKPTRHDDAAIVFAKLLLEGKLPETAKEFKNLVADAMRDKSGADYGKKSFSFEDAENYVQKTEEFIAMAKNVLKI